MVYRINHEQISLVSLIQNNIRQRSLSAPVGNCFRHFIPFLTEVSLVGAFLAKSSLN